MIAVDVDRRCDGARLRVVVDGARPVAALPPHQRRLLATEFDDDALIMDTGWVISGNPEKDFFYYSHHQNEDGDGHEDDGVPVRHKEVAKALDALLRQQDLAQGGQRAGGVHLWVRSKVCSDKTPNAYRLCDMLQCTAAEATSRNLGIASLDMLEHCEIWNFAGGGEVRGAWHVRRGATGRISRGGHGVKVLVLVRDTYGAPLPISFPSPLLPSVPWQYQTTAPPPATLFCELPLSLAPSFGDQTHTTSRL